MRSARLLQLMLRLQGSRGVVAEQLAEEFEVSVRTIYRDVAALSAAGVPVWTESGPGGGIRLLDGWQSKLSGMTDDETSALMLLGVPSIAADLGRAAAVGSAQEKLLRTLPGPLRDGATLWQERILVDVPGWFGGTDDISALPALASAVLDTRRVSFTYRDRARTVDPLGLVIKAGTWYLVASVGGAVLSFRVGRIEHAVVEDDSFARAADFDLASWWAASRAAFDRSLLRYPCRVRLSPGGWRGLRDVVGEEAARVKPEPADSDGWVSVDLRLESEAVALSQLVGLGAEVEVLEPLSLRTAMRSVGEAMVRRHR
ncbi:putative DNA-binding transcriptional regulator YafY [Rhodococcus sp. 27YEA15]|uniref:helix-turn-helix transcriptional regulator n=1 Tax=Rhodococcus sp. 27YEA15 TaxID=3156259 RepID=UPI003C7B52C2